MSRTYRKYKGKIYKDKESKNRKAARSCLNHGDCPICKGNRLYKTYKEKEQIICELKEYYKGECYD